MPKTATPRPLTEAEKRQRYARLTEQAKREREASMSPLARMLGFGDAERGLVRDTASAANDVAGRGVMASLIGLPGDLAGMGENGIRGLLGLPQVQPWGGSEHIGQTMQDYGLVSSERRPKTELLASLISPSAAVKTAVNAPKTAMNLLRMADNWDAPRTMARYGERGAVDVGDLGRMVAPQDEALRIAQQNAAKPVSEGGLGLRPDNTPEERAAAMGFDLNSPMSHGTDRNIKAFKVGKGGADEIGSGVYSAPIDSRPSGYSYSNAWAQVDGGINYPVVTKSDIADYDSVRGVLDTPNYKMPSGESISPPSEQESELIARIVERDPQWLGNEGLLRDQIRAMGVDNAIKKAGYAGARSKNSQVPNQVVTFDPRNIRSRFAAFDPMRRDSSDILAGLAPIGLGGYWYGQQEP